MKKIICIVLCFVTMLAAFKVAADTLIGYSCFENQGGKSCSSYTETQVFESKLKNDVGTVCNIVNDKIGNKKVHAIYDKEKEKAVNYLSEKIFKILSDFSETYGFDDTMAAEEILYKNVEYSIIDNSDYIISVSVYDVYTELYWESNEEPSKNRIKEYLNNSYNDFKYNTYISVDTLSTSSLHIYAEKDGINSSDMVFNKTGSSSVVTKEEAMQHDIYFVSSNGEIKMNGISEKALEYIQKYIQKVDTLIFYFDFTPYETGNLISRMEYLDAYNGVKDYFDTAKASYERTTLNILITVALAIFSIALGISYLLVTGKKSKEDKAKLIFIDYIPLELHFLITVALGIAATSAAMMIAEITPVISYRTVFTICAYASIIWCLLFELCSSIARSIRSERKLCKFFLCYNLGYAVYRIIKKALGKIISTIKYKPKAVRRRAIALTAGYFITNGMLMLFEMIALSERYYHDTDFFVVLIVLIFIVFNAVAIVLALRYCRKLDDVSYSLIERTDYEGDKDKLPPLLAKLLESSEYTNEELRNAVAKAVKDERLRTELITNVSHDLKTPLTSIINYVDLLSKCDIQDEKAQSYIKVLDEKGAKLKRLIDDLIEASKVTSGNVSVHLAPINLSELCLQATVDAQEDFDNAGLNMIVKPSKNANIVIADGSKTFRIIENLLSNARKYSAPKSRVYVSTYEENGYGVFEIKNISAQQLDISADELTERFVRGDKSRTQEGNGLGLSIAKELARLQNGELEITIDGDLFKAKVMLPNKY